MLNHDEDNNCCFRSNLSGATAPLEDPIPFFQVLFRSGSPLPRQRICCLQLVICWSWSPILSLSNSCVSRLSPSMGIAAADSIAIGLQVIAERDVSAGEELTITYGATKDNREMMLSYGFVPAGGNSADQVAGLGSPSGAAAALLSRSRKRPVHSRIIITMIIIIIINIIRLILIIIIMTMTMMT